MRKDVNLASFGFVGCIVFIHIGVGFEVAYLYRVGKFEGQECEISDEISRLNYLLFCIVLIISIVL